MTPTRTLHLADGLRLPLDAVTQTFLIVGKRGSGKSNTAARFVEQLHHARLPFVVLDPTDTWWGIKAGRDGARGLDVYVFGGGHQDLPLESGGGALLAEVLCEHRMPMVLSVKHLSGRERSAFMVAFAQTLFRKWSGGPLHVVLEEAHELAPQMGGRGGGDDGEAAMLGAFKRLWKLGRASGIGGTAVTQRPASLSKDITTQSEILIAHRTIGPQDVKAIGEWVKYHGEHEDILKDLPSLPTGEAFVWAPEFPEGEPLGLRRTVMLRRDTFDSASTPKVGEQRVEPKELAPVDLARLQERMAATIEKAKADDPKELRKELTRVRQELATAQRVTPERQQASQAVRSTLTDGDRALLEKVASRFDGAVEAIAEKADRMLTSIADRARAEIDASLAVWTSDTITARQAFLALLDAKDVRKVLDKLAAVRPAPALPGRVFGNQSKPADSVKQRPITHPVPARVVDGAGDPELGNGGLRRILIALAQRPQGLTLRQIGVRAVLSSRSGTFSTYMSRGRQAGWIQDGGKGGASTITEAGLAALGSYEPLPEGEALYRYWLNELGQSGAARILQALFEAAPNSLTLDELGARANLNPRSGTFSTYLSRLRTLELVESGRGWIKVSEELF